MCFLLLLQYRASGVCELPSIKPKKISHRGVPVQLLFWLTKILVLCCFSLMNHHLTLFPLFLKRDEFPDDVSGDALPYGWGFLDHARTARSRVLFHSQSHSSIQLLFLLYFYEIDMYFMSSWKTMIPEVASRLHFLNGDEKFYSAPFSHSQLENVFLDFYFRKLMIYPSVVTEIEAPRLSTMYLLCVRTSSTWPLA